MRNKNKGFILFFIFILLLMAGFFGLREKGSAKEKGIAINEAMYDPEGTDNKEKGSYEWIELKNFSSEEKNISGWELRSGTYFSLSVLTKPLPDNGFVLIYEGTGANSNTDFSEGDTAYLYGAVAKLQFFKKLMKTN